MGVLKIILHWCADIATRAFHFLALGLTVTVLLWVLAVNDLIDLNFDSPQPDEGLGLYDACRELMKNSYDDYSNDRGFSIDSEKDGYLTVTYHAYGAVITGTCRLGGPYDDLIAVGEHWGLSEAVKKDPWSDGRKLIGNEK